MLARSGIVGVIPVIGSGPGENWGWCVIMEVEVWRRIGEWVGGRHRVNGRGPGVLGAVRGRREKLRRARGCPLGGGKKNNKHSMAGGLSQKSGEPQKVGFRSPGAVGRGGTTVPPFPAKHHKRYAKKAAH